MPNPFDQFDAHASDGNPFDRFDAAAPRIESHARDGIESTAPAHLPAAAAPAPPDTRTEVGALDSYTRGTRAALHRTMGLGGMLGMPVASAADAIHAALSGHTETGAQDYWASHAIDPNYHAAQQLDIHPDTERQGFGGKVAGGVGALLPDLLAMLATGGEAPAAGGIVKPIVERSLAREVGDGISHAVGHAADASIVPGASHGASEAVQTVDNGGSILDALGHVPNDYLKAVAQNTLPLAAGARPGAGLLERVLTKGAQGAAAMPVVTAGMNQLEGHPTDAGDLGVQAVLGALMAQMGGDAPHDFKATDPVVDPNQRPAPVVEPRQGGEPVAGPDHVDLTTLPEQVAMQARADAAPPVVVHNAKPITPERRTQLEWMRDHGSPVERSTAEILLKANPAEPAQEPAGATPAPTAPTPAPEARVEAPVAPPAPAVEPAQPALADVLKMPENDYIAAVNPEGKTQSPDDHVILHTGDLPPTEAPKVAEFAAKDGTPVAVHRDDHGNLQAVVDGNVIATVDGHDGETSLNVVTEHQGNGIGKGLMKEYLRDNPLAPSGGFSAGGEATRRAAFRELQAEHAPAGEPATPVTAELPVVSAPGGDAPVQAHAEDAPTAATRNLKRWFGQSSVTDTWESGGEPRRLFHATRADFDSFKVGGDGTDALGAESGPVIFMTDNPERQNAAHNIGGFGGEFKDGARVMPLYARIENPLHVDEFNMEKLRAELGLSRGFPSLFTSADVAALKAAGHDGVIHFRSDYDGESTNEVIAFDKSQVKSATANSGAFDPSSGSLTDPLPAAAPPADVPPTSIKNEVTEAEADRDGVEAAASSGQPAWKDAWEKARADAARQPDAGRRLTADLIAHPRPIDTHETAALLHDRVRIHNELADARAATKDTAGKSDKQQGQDVARLLDLEQQRHDNDVASRQSGSENAAALNARKMMAASDYTLETVLQRAEVARGEKLPPEVTKRLEDMAATIADLHKRIEAKQAADKAAKAPKEKAPKKSVDEAMQEKIRKDIAALEARIKQRLSACPV